jgi:transposase InsO family protein
LNSVGVAERTFYFLKKNPPELNRTRGRKTSPPNKLTRGEVNDVKNVLLDKSMSDLSPREIYYKIMDEDNKIIASVSTFYRIARRENILIKRVKTSPTAPLNRETPHLLATGINQIWSWDVSQISSTIKNQRFYLYVIIDIWSRFVVGWTLEAHEKTDLAVKMWKNALEQQMVSGKGLTNHKDNGSIMRSGEMIKFVKDIEMIDSYSRAGVSDDNPFSEALFRTIKYFRDFPNNFCNLEGGRNYFENYFNDYNYINRHSGIQFLTPAQRHFGEEDKVLAVRNKLIKNFKNKNPHRYSSREKIFYPIIEVNIN